MGYALERYGTELRLVSPIYNNIFVAFASVVNDSGRILLRRDLILPRFFFLPPPRQATETAAN
jgi:hypothetical protein